MLRSFKTRVALLSATGALAVAGVGAAPAPAQPVVTGGLVNVTITNVLNNNTVTVQVPIAAAANLCNIQAAVLAQMVAQGNAHCDATANANAQGPPA